eukprot:1818659-Rhodomonas_salina.1
MSVRALATRAVRKQLYLHSKPCSNLPRPPSTLEVPINFALPAEREVDLCTSQRRAHLPTRGARSQWPVDGEGGRDRGTEGQRDSGTAGQRDRGTEGQRDRGRDIERNRERNKWKGKCQKLANDQLA